MDQERASALVGELGELLGIPGVVLDESGMVTLVLGDAPRLVNLGFNAPAGTLDLMLCLDEVVPTASQLSRLMAANFGWTATLGAVLALEPTSGALVVQRRCGEEVLSSGLVSVVEGLITVGEAWASRLAADPQAGADDAVIVSMRFGTEVIRG